MHRQRVDSSNIRSIGYDKDTKLLEIEFHSDSIYQYSDVDQSVHSALMKAGSTGSFFYRNIRDRYPATKMR